MKHLKELVRQNKTLYIGVLIGITAFTATVLPVHADEVQLQDSVISINRDGSAFIIERITYDFGAVMRHGIYRDLPAEITDGTHTREVAISDVSVTAPDGLPIPFETLTFRDKIRLQIGDPAKKVTGIHSYVVRYRMHPVVTAGQYVDELLVPVSGMGWLVPVNRVRAEVIFPEEVQPQDLAIECLEERGNTSQCTTQLQVTRPLRAIYTSTEQYPPGVRMTISATFPKGIVQPAPVPPDPAQTQAMAIILGVIVLTVISGGMWYLGGSAPKPEEGIVSGPPDDLSPGELEMVQTGDLSCKGLLGELLVLCQKGYLKMEYEDDALSVALTENTPAPSELNVVGSYLIELVGSQQEFSLSDKEDMSVWKEAVSFVRREVGAALYETGYLKADPLYTSGHWNTAGALVALAGLGAIGMLQEPVWGIGLVCLAALLIAIGRLMHMPTRLGMRAQSEAQALARYLTQHPHVDSESADTVLNQLLPYAMVLGVPENRRVWIIENTPPWFHSSHPWSPAWFAAELTKTVHALESIHTRLSD
jgi:hypothetical protein